MRLKNIFRNSFFSLISQLVLILVGFFSQRVMNFTMGEALVGMNGVISNIIAILSVSELGIASAVVYHLYKALADQDEKAIASLMNLYRRGYYIFAAAITVMGLGVMPFVHCFMKSNCFSLSYIRLIYVLWLARTVLSYLLSCKRSILIADQKEYIVSMITLIMNVLNYGFIIVILKLWQNYPLALFLNVLTETVLNVWIIRYVDRKYPYLKKNRRISMDSGMRRTIMGDLKNIFVSRLSSKLLLSTDNLIISGFISVGVVGRYMNYSLITQSIINLLVALSSAVQPSVGNLFVEKDREKDYQVLRQMTFVFFLLASFSCAGLMSLMTRFVTDFWLSERYGLDRRTVACCVMNCYLIIMNLPMSMVMTVSGMFDRERNISILYAAVNLIVSLLLVKPLGITGVLIGTSVSYAVQMVFRVYFFFRHYLHRGSGRYVLDLLQYGIVALLETAVACFAVDWVYQAGGLAGFVLAMLVCISIPNGLNVLFYIRSWRMQSLIYRFQAAVRPGIRKEGVSGGE